MDKMPKLTILTALSEFNNDIIKTLNSLKFSLSCNKLKWIIKSSSQATEDQLLNFKGLENNILFIGEKDHSLYEGLNRGLEFIDTEYFLVLGAGDILFTGAVDFLNNKILSNPEADGFMFPVCYDEYIFPVMLDAIHYRMPCSHQGMILKTKNVSSLGGFNKIYRYVADYDLICRYFTKYTNILTFSNPIGENQAGGLSDKNKFEAAVELYLIAHKYWKNKYEEFELNDVILQNLQFVNNFLKTKKTKKEKGENMQTPSEIRQEVFSYLLNIENERKMQEQKKEKELYSNISQIFEVLEIANKEFEDLKSEMVSIKETIDSSFKKKEINNQIRVTPLKEKKHIEDIISTNEKLKTIFGFTKKKLDQELKKDDLIQDENKKPEPAS